MHIDFHDNTKSVSADIVDTIQQLLLFAAKKEGIAREAEISVNFVDDNEIQALNRNYRQLDKPTDVLSFALQDVVDEELDIIGEDSIPLALGDIVISVDTASRQADEYGHSDEREFCFLALHGFLHLLGYDHMNTEDETIMTEKQNELLESFGIGR
ncbi:rRNA maturation RNase YbeY [Lentibacillus saliphilus]|uniref:rRNA maturation RNase YbeY n=1 Tax=Lentibacillus saliphilus TaxID=2737028 RepID=UPI001C2FDB40|nr:rRNA maturation RNase YbeY [Lentibacillus saliphilus]